MRRAVELTPSNFAIAAMSFRAHYDSIANHRRIGEFAFNSSALASSPRRFSDVVESVAPMMPMAGAIAFGLVLGWASAFVGLTRPGLLFRLFSVLAGATSVLSFGWPSTIAALVAAATGMAAHDLLIFAIRRRIA